VLAGSGARGAPDAPQQKADTHLQVLIAHMAEPEPNFLDRPQIQVHKIPVGKRKPGSPDDILASALQATPRGKHYSAMRRPASRKIVLAGTLAGRCRLRGT
jgi:hypothetical protein